MSEEYTSYRDNANIVEKDIEKLKRLGIKSPSLNWSKAIRIGNAIFFPKNEKRRKAILERYGIKEK